jgi:amidase
LIAAFTTIWNLGGTGITLDDPDRIEPHNRALRGAARSIDSWAYAENLKETQRLSRRIVEGFIASFDLLVTPTMACLPPPIGAWKEGIDEEPLMALLNSYPMAVFTSLFNVTGQPAISVPVHHDHVTGLPVGVQIVAAPWREDLLLQVAYAFELALPWADRRPVVS